MTKLTDLIEGLVEEQSANMTVLDQIECTQITSDSRKVQPGALFLAYRGSCGDSKCYLEQAIAQGAKAVLIDETPKNVPFPVPYLVMPNLADLIAVLADRFYDFPQNELSLYGVTGTNGKTSTSYYLAQMLDSLGIRAAVIGTTGWGRLPDLNPCDNTTPGVIELRKMLSELVVEGVQAVVMEVSSHGLDQGRVDGLYFKRAIFTNLTQDHLDYHGSMERYAEAKFKLFGERRAAMGVFNADDECGKRFSERLEQERVFTYSALKNRARADLMASEVQFSSDSICGALYYKGQKCSFTAPLIGEFNLYNLLAAAATLLSEGYELSKVAKAVSCLVPVKGRMEIIKNPKVAAKVVVVDYAHTPDALYKALTSLRAYCATRGKLWVVFGCGGDRDSSKRGKMGAIASTLADRVVITSDNPRSERPLDVINDILSGIDHKEQTGSDQRIWVEEDRALAIALALREAEADDVVLIAGKGHEEYQIIGKSKHPFSDQRQVLGFEG